MAGSRQVVITYGTFDTNDSGFSLTGVHTWDMDERTFRIVFDVVLHQADAFNLQSQEGSMIAQLNERHKTLTVAVGATTYYVFKDGVDGALSGIEEGAEFIKATWQTLPEHRTEKSRAYRIEIVVTRAAKQPGKIGVYDQRINVSTLPSGQRRLHFRAQFTPGPNTAAVRTALESYEDATYGFDALVSAIQTTLTGTWERVGSINQSYDEDHRTLTASATYMELLFDQSAEGRNDADLINVRYDIQVDRPPGYTIPGKSIPKPLSAITINFSAQVDVARGKDLKAAIDELVVPYVTSTVAKKLTTTGTTPKLMKHNLKADYVGNRIAGTLFYLAEETTIIELSKRVVTSYKRGITLVPVLDGKEFTRDIHTGPGQETLHVVLGARVLGRSASYAMGILEKEEVRAQNRKGYMFLGYSTAYSPTEEHFFTSGQSIETTVQTTTLMFERANIRPPRNISGPGATQQRQQRNLGRSFFEVGDSAALERAQKSIEHQLGGLGS